MITLTPPLCLADVAQDNIKTTLKKLGGSVGWKITLALFQLILGPFGLTQKKVLNLWYFFQVLNLCTSSSSFRFHP